ncbi:MAG: hypothetical protein M3355_00790 [Actinomycetota bacterium]|nr:hypothetical protein [Actinomycetota bacterium]
MPPLPMLAQALVAAANSLGDLLPFLVVMVAGFLVGAWGQASRSPIAVIAGMSLILLAVAGFLGDNGDGPIPDVLK